MKLLFAFVFFFLLLFFMIKTEELYWRQYPTRKIEGIAELTNIDRIMQDVENISTVRVSGTKEIVVVRDYIVKSFQDTKFKVELDKFVDKTPFGEKEFANIIASYNPKGKKTLLLAAHYDSKYFPDPNDFVGATDSAVSCGILLDLARTLNSQLSPEMEYGLQIVFFDGEEAFVEWKDNDSLFGARHLAEKWTKQESAASNYMVKISMNSNIGLFVLLDLLGSDNCHIYDFFQSTSKYHQHMGFLEKKMKEDDLIDKNMHHLFHDRKWYNAGLQDDHIPFLKKGVPVLHLIPVPFPSVWHTDQDIVANVHKPSVSALASVIRVFTAQILHL